MSTREKVIALGFFDGVHLGHAALLRRTVEEAARRGVLSAVFTFDRHPSDLYADTPVQLINSAQDRADREHRAGLRNPAPRRHGSKSVLTKHDVKD